MHRVGKHRWWGWWGALADQIGNQYATGSNILSATGIRVVSEGPNGTFTFLGIGGSATVDIPVATAIGQRYRVTFDLTGVGVDLGIGSTTAGSDLLGVSVSVGTTKTYEFVATGPTSWIRFGSNAIALAVISNFKAEIVFN